MKQGSTVRLLVGFMVLVSSLNVCQGRIKFFSVSKIKGDKSTCVALINDVVLVCETDEDTSNIEIKRFQDGDKVSLSHVVNKSLIYEIRSVACSDVGTYECIEDDTERLTTDLVITECPPQPCDGADVQTTMFVEVNEAVNFSLCVLACPGIAPHAHFNGESVRKKKLSNWTWDYEQTNSPGLSSNRFNVHVTRERMVAEYGLLRVTISSLANKLWYVEYNITLKPPGIPHCPTHVTVTSHGHDYVTLSWKPGLDGGSRQYFSVYYSKNNVIWFQHGDSTGSTTENVTSLSSNTSYYFRVVSWNQYSSHIDATICENTVVGTTSLPQCPKYLTITNHGHDYITLSWKPGLDGGSNQYFSVYYSKDNVTWFQHGDNTGSTTENVTGLSSNSSYYFRVVSWNKYSTRIDATICESTVVGTTSSLFRLEGSLDNPIRFDNLVLIICSCSLLVAMLLLSALLCWRRKVNREQTRDANQRKEEAQMVTSQNGSSPSSGDYVTDDGLTYITVYPIHDKRRNRKKKREKQEKIQYVTLDFIKTEKLRRNLVHE